MVGGPPPINTGAPVAGYPPQQIPPQMQGGPPVAGGPPGYTGAGGYGAPPGQSLPTATYGRPAAEVEGSSRSKAQLIVGIDFVSTYPQGVAWRRRGGGGHQSIMHADQTTTQGTTFSGVAFAFATNNEAKEDIITEWPGAGSYTKQKVRDLAPAPASPHQCPAPRHVSTDIDSSS